MTGQSTTFDNNSGMPFTWLSPDPIVSNIPIGGLAYEATLSGLIDFMILATIDWRLRRSTDSGGSHALVALGSQRHRSCRCRDSHHARLYAPLPWNKRDPGGRDFGAGDFPNLGPVARVCTAFRCNPLLGTRLAPEPSSSNCRTSRAQQRPG